MAEGSSWSLGAKVSLPEGKWNLPVDSPRKPGLQTGAKAPQRPLPQRPEALVLLPVRPPPSLLTCAGRCLYRPLSPRPPPWAAPR